MGRGRRWGHAVLTRTALPRRHGHRGRPSRRHPVVHMRPPVVLEAGLARALARRRVAGEVAAAAVVYPLAVHQAERREDHMVDVDGVCGFCLACRACWWETRCRTTSNSCSTFSSEESPCRR